MFHVKHSPEDAEQYDRAAERHPVTFWVPALLERYCITSGLTVRMIPGDRCRAHGAAPVMCDTDVRVANG